MFRDIPLAHFATDHLQRYRAARCLPAPACAQQLAALVWAQWSTAAAPQPQPEPQHPRRWFQTVLQGRHASLGSLRNEESAPWRALAWDPAAAWPMVHCALAAIDPELARLADHWCSTGQLEWLDQQDAVGASCHATPTGLHIRAPQPNSLPGVALLAHELGHALHAHHRPGALAHTLDTETIALACERWVLAWLLGHGGDVAVGRAVHAWLQARSTDLQGRHAMLHSFECALATLCQADSQPPPTDTINTLWLHHNHAFFGPQIALPADFAWAWTEVQPLYLRPGSLGAYPAAWAASAPLASSSALRQALL